MAVPRMHAAAICRHIYVTFLSQEPEHTELVCFMPSIAETTAETGLLSLCREIWLYMAALTSAGAVIYLYMSRRQRLQAAPSSA